MIRLQLESLERRLAPATFLVSNANDAGSGSLRQAILAANAAAGPDSIAFDATFFATPRTIALSQANGQLPISDDLDVVGPGASRLTVTGNTFTRVFTIGNSASTAIAVSLAGLTVTGGNGSNGGPAPSFDNGGGIRVENEFLTLTDVVVTANTTANQFIAGGGIHVLPGGRLDLLACTVSGNTAGIGGGISFEGTGLTVQNSTISGNVATTNSSSGGGGIYFDGGAQGIGFTLRNSTVAGNTSASNGGGIWLGVTSSTIPLVIQNSTITGNTANGTGPGAGFGGGGIFLLALQNGSAVLNVQSSIVSGNAASAASGRSDIAAVNSTTVNVNFSAVGDPDGFTPSATSGNNLPFGTALNLRPLGNYGGPTATCGLGVGSPAVDGGSNLANLTTDQRGAGFPRVLGGVADIGACEGIIDVPVAFGGPFASVTTAGPTYTFDVVYSGTTPIDVSTLDNTDVRVTGPGTFNQLATFVTVTPTGNGTPRTATYRITGPGGAFGMEDNGVYTIAVQAGQVANTSGFTNQATTLGTFTVAILATFTVTNANDAGAGSLRQAIDDANNSAGAANVVFDPTFFATPRTITLSTANGSLVILDHLTVIGPGADRLTVNGGGVTNVFQVGSGVIPSVLALSGMTVTGGTRGIIAFDGTLTLTNMVVTGNNAGTASGGGIMGARADLAIVNSTIAGNTAALGGGIFLTGGSLLLDRSTVSGNGATGSGGGGIGVYGSIDPAGFVVRNSTVSGNTTAGSGGGLFFTTFDSQYGPVAIQNSTITGNTANATGTAAGTGGGGLALNSIAFLGSAAIGVTSSIISGNTASVANGRSDLAAVANGVITANFSAIGDPDGFTLSGTSGNNLPFGTALGLGTLANNGGPTQTIAFAANSPLRDVGSNPAALTTDQRGPGFARPSGPGTDIGAFEFQVAAPPRVSGVTVNAGQTNATQRSRVTSLTVTFDAQVTFAGSVAAAFTLSRIGGAAVGGFTATANVVGGVTVVTLTSFTGAETYFGSLADGRYTVLVRANQVSAGGSQLDGDGNGTGGDDYTLAGTVANGLYRLFGDVDGSGVVNAFDFSQFRNAFGSSTGQAVYVEWLDIDGNGAINAFDFAQFRTRFGSGVP